MISRTALERPTKAGDSPVGENYGTLVLWGHIKAIFVTKFNIFERDKEDEQNHGSVVAYYVEEVLRNLTKSQTKILNCSRKIVLM